MSVKRIVVVSDCTDVAFVEMRSSIFRAAEAYAPDARVQIEPLVPVQPFSVLNAGFMVRLVAEISTPDTMIMFIMNSIRERTERIIGRTEKHGFVFEGTNTGAVGWLIEEFGVAECYEVHDPGFVPFGGKFVHGPAVGQFAAGRPMAEIGTPFPVEKIRRTLPDEGTIVHVDNFGNAKFPLGNQSFEYGDELVVEVGGEVFEAVYWKRMMELEDGTWVVYPGSSFDLHEFGEVRGKGLLPYGIGAGAQISVKRA
ncbi:MULTISPECIES: SAM-dependent chlorinase/fluorinase [unclassified Streptomyces]|uniref:SAM-dependent chlorinase/fluorinase n=1 Tax=unclassified Streptomyces TaxID=2593676 RepID=UPI00131720F4|nr:MULTISPECIES: SAM-dependent chlorinase/fluorinase [unclassified Streptomyces]QHC32445.1 hypothetical protein GR129_30330 [Streptomyces sp. HF10]WKE68512.1 SAM-dependent chlorinase/fluorinase [Streptomyces sp. WP-1]